MKKLKWVVVLVLVLSALFVLLALYIGVQGELKTGTIQYRGETYKVNIDKIEKGDKDNISIEILLEKMLPGYKTNRGQPFEGVDLDIAERAFRIKIVVQNKTIEASLTGFNMYKMSIDRTGKLTFLSARRLVYQVDTTTQPEKIIVYNDQGSSVTFDGKTKKISK